MPKSFDDLKKVYEQGVNLDEISTEEQDILFLKIRSLTKKNLINLCINKGIIKEGEKYSDWELRKKVFDNFSHEELNKFIEKNVEKDLIKISYNYTKDEKVSGSYKTDCFMLIIERN